MPSLRRPFLADALRRVAAFVAACVATVTAAATEELPFAPVDRAEWVSAPDCAPLTELTSGCGAAAPSQCGVGTSSGCGGGCCDDFWTRPALGGDWFGTRSHLAESGILADVQLTQFYQGVASGGREQDFRYGGKLDYFLNFQGAKLGLNEGFSAVLHAETRYGEDVNFTSSAFSFPNSAMLYPLPGSDETAITGLTVVQALSEEVALTAGKFNTLDLWNMLFPTSGRGIDGFMNLSMVATPGVLRTTNLSVMGAGVLALEGKQIQGGVLVYDTNNSSTTSGFDQLFDDGAVMLGFWRFFTDYGGKPGSHTFLGNYSTRTYASLERSSWTFIPGEGLVPGQEDGSWMLGYVFDQVLWQDQCNANRNWRMTSTWTITDGNPSPYSWTGNVALQRQGPIRGRDMDTAGVGYFYDGLSGDFKRLVRPFFDLQDLHGGEVYYNAAITPWFHLTADLQAIQTENARNDGALILGLRANLRL